MKNTKLGELEELVLLAIGGLREDAYTVSIQQFLEEHTGRSISMGAMYTALERLSKKGFSTSEMTDPVAERGGKSKRIYEVTYEGERALREAHDSRLVLWRKFQWSPAWG